MASKMVMCGPCSRLSKTSEGLKYCTDCEDTLCTNCAALHSAVKLLASHHLVDVSVKTGNTFNIQKNCNDHEDMCLEFYCSDHDCLICRTCMANTHRTCGKIQPIDVAAKGCRTSSMFEDVSKHITSLLISTKALFKDRQKKKISVGQSKANVLNEIAKFRQNINEHLDQLEKKCCSEVDILERTISKTISNELIEAEKRQHLIQNIWEQVDFFTKHGSESQLFIYINTVKAKISRQAVSLQDLLPSLETNVIGFESSDLISVMKSFGTVKRSSIPCTMNYQQPKHMQAQTRTIPQKVPTKFEFEKKVNISGGGRITCITVTINNNLLICNDQAKQISLMTDTGQHLQTCTVAVGRVWGITPITGTAEAIVTLPDNKLIQFFHTTSFTLGRQILVNVHPYGVAVIKNNVIVGTSSGKIVFIDLVSGKCLKTLNIGSGIIVSIVSVVDDKDDLLYCCEYSGGQRVICLRLDGTQIFSHSFGNPMCLALDSKGNSYVTGYQSNDFHRLSPDAKVDDILLKGSDGLDWPLAVAFNITFEKLYISNSQNNNCILIFNCK